MGNKRKRSKQSAGPSSSTSHSTVWPDHTVDELLSYLNSQVAFMDPATETQKGRDFDDVDQELARYLNHLRDDGKPSLERLRNYSAGQIRTKLRWLYINCKLNEDDDSGWRVIYAQGFACLDWKDDSEREARMARRSKAIKHNWKWEFLHSPRKTRAGSQNPPWRDLRAPSSTPDLRRRVGRSRVAESHSLRQKGAMDDVQHVSDTESLATEDDSNIVVKIERVSQKPYVLLTSEHDEIQRARSSVRDSQELSESEREAFSTPLRSLTPVECGNSASDGNFEQSPSTLRLMKRLHAVETELSMVKQDTELEIDFWKAKYREAQGDRSRFKKSRDALFVKQSALRENNLSVEEDLMKCQALVDDLFVKLDSHKRVQDVKRHMDTGPDSETISEVSKLMQNICDRLQATLKDAKLTSVPELEELPEDHLLRSLFEQAFGVEWKSPKAREWLECWRKSSWLHQCGLLALCGAALARWVFQQTQADIFFDRYQDVGTRSSTNRYRHAIELVGQSDPALARTVDLIVHKRVADEDTFEHFQRAKGKDLARKLQEALAPLCQLDPYTEEQSDADPDDDGYAIGLLSEVFFSAIDIQCRLVLAGRRYECAWHEPGAPFDKTSMSQYRGQEISAADAPTVRLTLLPGINQVKADRISVDFGGFAERRHVDYEKAVCLVRAVVLRGSANLH